MDIFSCQFFVGLEAGFELDSRNDALLPTQGVYWNTTLAAMQELNGDETSYG